ncbi:MAG: OmcA/MtrC family decaheme c-type cytochrome [Betaproteobacteria bacterium]|nr:MAG: OmcA/MtrC family decaheme c-type cytochrome [Betaproteobacteria bacterium]
MKINRSSRQQIDHASRAGLLRALTAGALVLALASCGGGGGSSSAGGTGVAAITGGSSGTAAALTASTALNMAITGVSINSPPVVSFTVTNQAGTGMAGLTAADLRFNIAKLVPSSSGGPSSWQNYINRAGGGAVQGTQEQSAAGYAFGTLANKGDGSYSYTFATDIKNAACPAPCTDAAGKALDLSYQPGLSHRVTIEQANSAYPKSAGVFDFVPDGSGSGAKRDIVAAAKCNECHGEVRMPGTNRVDTRLCVTCHNPGTSAPGAPSTPLDFKVLIHKIHNGSGLPSVVAGTPYTVGGIDYSKAVFPQDVRNCSRCHDGTAGAANATAQGDNWKTQPSAAACGSCHDNVYFGIKADPARAYQTKPHSGGVQSDDGNCALCHATGRFTDKKDIVVAHNFPTRFQAASAKFKYNIISVAPTTAGSTPVITFSVTDPTNANAPYDIKTAAAFTAAGGASRLAVSIGWSTADFGNDGSGQSFGQPISIDALAASVAGATAGTYTVTSTVAIPAGQTGTLRVTIDGHPAADVTTAGSFTDRLKVTSVFKDAAISGSVSARRTVVDVAKCNVCHSVLSLHGNNRTDEPQVCAVCHNPNATDAGRRPAAAGVLTGGTDGKLEQSIDFKTMIHAIHAGETGKGGIRTKGITVYGFGGSVNDFSKVVFPGKLNNCAACHAGTSYQLAGVWAAPTANGILGSTISTGTSAADPADNLRITPTAAVCASCHDGASAKSHMQTAFNGANFSATQTAIKAAAEENCSFCHGAGKSIDVKTIHGVN